jgi:hypothetical protein
LSKALQRGKQHPAAPLDRPKCQSGAKSGAISTFEASVALLSA